jgi:RimJ/RimL family protein N-acetyltransferase
MISDGVVVLRAMGESELELAHAMSVGRDTQAYIVPYSLERHRSEYAKKEVVYLTIAEAEPRSDDVRMAGYFILVREPDGDSVECRRIVVDRKNQGFGKRAMRLLDRYCREVLGRRRIWLDVYEFNARGRRVYESCGYRLVKHGEQDGKTLLFYEKLLD